MINYIIMVPLLMAVFGLMAAALHFSKYRSEPGRCCSSGLADLDDSLSSCDTCPNKESDQCRPEKESDVEAYSAKIES